MQQQILVESLGGRTLCFQFDGDHSIQLSALKEVLNDRYGLPSTLLRYSQNGKELENDFCTIESCIIPVRLSLRVVGGKGGFGSLLRGAPAKPGVKKTTNFEACRDLNGRRLRHVNNEKKLEKWLSEKKDRALEKVAESYLKKITRNQHQFDDNKFDKQIKDGIEVVQNAVEEGLKQAVQLKKRKREVKEEEPNADIVPVKKPRTNEPSNNNIISTTTSTTQEMPPIISQPITTSTEGKGKGIDQNTIEIIDTKIQEDKSVPTPQVQEEFDINKYENAEQLQELGLERLKQELQSRGMKCGGSLKERAERLFKIKGVTHLSVLDAKLLTTKPNKK